MHRLENESIPIMEPMLLDKSRFLDAKGQWIISRWALKTAMVLDSTIVSPQRPQFYSSSECSALKNSGEIPDRSFAWIGRDLDSGYAAAATRLTFRVPNSLSADCFIERAPGHVSTFLVGSLAIQVVTVRFPGKYRDGAITLNPTEGPWDHLLVTTWPPRRKIYWPPALAFRDDIPGLAHNTILTTRWNVGIERKIF
jgi:hypothetical protein